MTWFRHSRRMDPINLSAYGFCHGLDGAVITSPMSILPIRRRKLGGPPGAEKARGKPGPKPAAAKAAAEAEEAENLRDPLA